MASASTPPPTPLAADDRPAWKLACPEQAQVAELRRRHDLSELLCVLLANRGFEAGDTTLRHLGPDLANLHDPFLLPDMEAATERLKRAIDGGETILIHGDYDVDGVTGTALLVRLLRLVGAKVEWHIPNRFTDGYSFGDHSIAKAEATGATLVISVDNGTSAKETIDALLERGIETIVTDHHEPPRGELPKAVAIVNPKLPTSQYPFRELCGGAVAFKLAWGLAQKISGASKVTPKLREFLMDAMGLVAIATVCDVVPLVDENRVLARWGLKALGASRHPGVRALLEVCDLAQPGRRLGGEDVGFQIGPRINASGRLATAAAAVDVLLAETPEEGRRLSAELDAMNVERKRIERALTAEAMVAMESFADPVANPVLVVSGQGWHQGVIGIVASRLVDAFGRPAIVIGLDGDTGRGSARSIPGFDLLGAMHAASDHFERYGGHAMAAGCEVRADAVDAVREKVCAAAAEALANAPRPPLDIDAEFSLADLDETAMGQLDRLEPFGALNEKPVLLSRGVRLAEPPRVIGADRSHLLLSVRHGERVHKALAFGMARRVHELAMGEPIDLVYTPRWNWFRGQVNLELITLDFARG